MPVEFAQGLSIFGSVSHFSVLRFSLSAEFSGTGGFSSAANHTIEYKQIKQTVSIVKKLRVTGKVVVDKSSNACY